LFGLVLELKHSVIYFKNIKVDRSLYSDILVHPIRQRYFYLPTSEPAWLLQWSGSPATSGYRPPSFWFWYSPAELRPKVFGKIIIEFNVVGEARNVQGLTERFKQFDQFYCYKSNRFFLLYDVYIMNPTKSPFWKRFDQKYKLYFHIQI